MKLNLACGKTKLEGYLNVDCDATLEPDQLVDILKPFPWNAGSIEKVLLFHAIEHVPKHFHIFLLQEIHKVLQQDGELLLAYPEWSRCAKNWLENFRGTREYWEATLYGRQTSPYDVHVCIIDTPQLLDFLRIIGFKDITFWPDKPPNEHNTVLRAIKCDARITYLEDLKEEVFGHA